MAQSDAGDRHGSVCPHALSVHGEGAGTCGRAADTDGCEKGRASDIDLVSSVRSALSQESK